MAIVVESVGVSPGADSGNCIIVKPTGVAVGDLLIAAVAFAAGGTSTPPAGWTLISQDPQLATFYKIATATEVAATDFTFQVFSGSNIGAMLRLSGAGAVTFDQMFTTTLASTTFDAGAMGTHDLYVVAGGSNALNTWTQPAGATERVDIATGAGADSSVMIQTTLDPTQFSAITRDSSTGEMNVIGFFIDEISTVAKTIQAKARVKQLGVAKTIQAKGRVKQAGIAKTIQAKARVRQVGAKTIRAKADIKQFGVAKTIRAKARVRQLGVAKTIQAKARVRYLGVAKTIQAKARILVSGDWSDPWDHGVSDAAGIAKTIQAKADIKQFGVAKTIQAKGRVKQAGIAKTIQAKARILTGVAKTIQSKARVKQLGVAKTISAKAAIAGLSATKTIQAKGRVKQAGIAKTIQAKGRVQQLGLAKTVTAKSRLKQTGVAKTIRSKARVKQLGVINSLQARAWIAQPNVVKTVTAKARIRSGLAGFVDMRNYDQEYQKSMIGGDI